MRAYKCDQCGAVMDDEPPVAVCYFVEVDDTDVDDELGGDSDWMEEKHLCGFSCLASWAMSQALDAPV